MEPHLHIQDSTDLLLFVDDYSRFAIAYSVESKDKAGEALKKYLVSACNLLGEDEKICYIRSDQGTDLRVKIFYKY